MTLPLNLTLIAAVAAGAVFFWWVDSQPIDIL